MLFSLEYFFQLGDCEYAALAVLGNSLCFDPPSTFSRDEVTERVVISLTLRSLCSLLFLLVACVPMQVEGSTNGAPEKELT